MNANLVRVSVAVLTLSAAGWLGIAERESYSGVAYPDPTRGWVVPTIGFGVTGADIKKGDVTDPVKAVRQSITFTNQTEEQIRACLGANTLLYPSEWDRWVKFAYNVGTEGFCKSQIAKRLREGKYPEACEQILEWKFSNKQDCSDPGNRTCRGLWKDRLAAHEACVGDLTKYANPEPSAVQVAIQDAAPEIAPPAPVELLRKKKPWWRFW